MSFFNTFNNNPTLKDLFDAFKRDVFLNLNCHAIATIQSFNASNQTVSASINYTRTYYEKNSDPTKNEGSFYKAVDVDYALLVDCPVIILSGGESLLTFPIKKGDQCLMFFNDRSIDQWFENGQKASLKSNRLHSLSDGIAIIGLRPLNKSIANYDESRAVLRSGGAALAVRDDTDKVLITNNYPENSVTLRTLLQTLITQVQSLVTATAAITVTGVTSGGGVSGVPANAATITAISTQLSNTSTQIGALLE